MPTPREDGDVVDDDMNDDNSNVEVSEFLSMSDEDAQKQFASMASAPAAPVAKTDDAGAVVETDEDKAAQAAAIAALDSDDDKGDVDEDPQGKADSKTDVGGSDAASESKANTPAVDKDGKPVAVDASKEKVEGDGKAKPGDEGAKGESEAIDYKAAYERLTAPFTANGKQMKVDSIDDAITLMQMGANYNKKMAGLKPSLKLVKMLDTAGITNEGDLSFLIDLHKRDAGAINKLVLDSKLDPLDLSADKAGEYKPGNHAVGDDEMELASVLDELKDSPAYAKTLQVVATDWDQSSKQEVLKAPRVMKLIAEHINAGIYDIIHSEIDKERTLGRLQGLTDIQAYQKVGDAINARGGFNHLNQGSSQTQKENPAAAPVIVTPKPKKDSEEEIRAARKAASGTKAAAPGTKAVPADYNPLSMSDADFAKFKI